MFKITCSLCLSLMMLPALINAKPPKHQTKDGFLIVEAEEFHDQSAVDIRKWYRLPEENNLVKENSSNDIFIKNASNGSYIGIFPDTRKDHNDPLIKGENFSNEPGQMAIVSYKIQVDQPGRYYVWARVFSTGSEDNGVHVGIDGTWPESGQRMQWCMGKNDWRWESSQRTVDVHCGVPGSIYLDIDKAGEHEIQFSMREDGFKMDQFILTNDKTFNPRAQKNTEESKIASINEVIKRLDPSAVVIPASEFDKGEFYLDQGKWLAIQPEERKSAKAEYKINDKSGNYDVIFFAIGENDGQSSYQLQINGASKGNYKVPLSKKTFEEGIEFAHPFRNLSLNKGDVISVEAKTGSKDGSEYSRGRWSQIVLVKQWSAHDLIDKVLKETGPQTTVDMSGELKKWHKLTLTFDGPFTSEKAAYNPFMNYRLNVTFKHKASGKSYMVPGYFAADGVAGNSSSDEGNKWKVHFSPDEIGEWEYNVDFRKGAWSAVSDKKETGKSGGYMDGASGSFTIAPTDKSGNDFRSKGRLQYVGERYLKFAETGEYFLKQGPDAPENLLAYIDFDGDFATDGHKDDLVKNWNAHLQDWKNGDVTWKGGKGKALIGALNYLASKGLNSVSFLTNNIAGDDQNVFPYIDYDTYDRIDISKMDQWEMVFQHAQKLGLFLHFKTLEAENQGLLDNGGVGANSKLYYRELMARFGHHLALNWNLCEENGEWMKNHETPPQDTPERLAMAHYFKTHDPYHHHLVIHNGKPYDDLLGPESGITGPSIQTHKPDFSIIHKEVLHWLEASKKAGFQWAAAVDEPGDAQHSLLPDAENPDHDNARRNALWGTLMAGGWGNEWYFGYAHAHSDLTCQDFRSRDLFWDQAVNALRFFKEQNIPFWQMENKNDLVGNSDNKNTIYCLAKENEIYVVYLNSVASGQLDLTNADGDYEIWWFNPKKNEKLRKSKVKTAKGGTIIDLGKSPDKKQLDWVVMVKKK